MAFGKKSVLGIFCVVLAYYFNRNTNIKIGGKLVNTSSGIVKGIISKSRDGREYYEWLGIPYAEPPVGKLRFATPQPVVPWKGIRDASEYGNECAQFDMLLQKKHGVEDCLFLNVHVPKRDEKDDKLLPVMFFIHGGYFAGGGSDSYRPDYFMDEDVVIVTVNYRVGALGFLNTGDKEARGNMGLKDQVLALKWVHENIERFGGNPKQTTVFGESAGGVSVHLLTMSPMSKHLMQKAISQSGTALCVWGFYDEPVKQAKRFAGILDCPTESSAEMVECLRNKDVNDFLEAHRETLDIHHQKEALFVPSKETIIDEETFLPDEPAALLKAGKVAKIPWLSGGNANEGLISGQVFYKNETFRKAVAQNWAIIDDTFLLLTEKERAYSKNIKDFYFGKDVPIRTESPDQFPALADLITDRLFFTGMHTAAIEHARHAPVYLYYYTKIGPTLMDLLLMFKGRFPPIVEVIIGRVTNWFYYNVLGRQRESFGVCHADELAMLFHMPRIFYIAKDDPNYEFSKDLVRTWVSFATTNGHLSFRNTKIMPVDLKEKLTYLEINDKSKVIKPPFLERVQFWESLAKMLR